MAEPDADTDSAPSPPIIVDLGKVGRKQIKKLKQGRGPLAMEVDEVIEALRRELGEETAGKEIVPVVLLYRRKRKKKKLWNW